MPKKKDRVQEIIEKSGNDLQFQVAEYLSGHKWQVSISPYYNDPATGKPREIDLIATRRWEIKVFWGHKILGALTVRLFIECKHIKEPIIFWFRDKQMSAALKLAKDNIIMHDKPDYYFNQTPVSHHYIDNSHVAKISAKGGNRDDIFEAMNQCLNALIFFSNSRNIPGPYNIDFPVIVVDSLQNLYRRNTNSGYTSITEPFQLEIDYSYKQSRADGNSVDLTKYFLLDIVSFDKLDQFLQDLENRDIKLFRENLHWDLEHQ